ncbi:hypothetical protein O181_107596 [Austropuccinia psidii MF-1]|uniref:Uncharacterized protein n=1 Tax=Austropuccinia psidii MF-1 TaxID=1389203 RepID=A0A9Q3JTN3_9BASI|nr:hypothetical protein [Austropuccinia psidii MF-1]
MLRNIGPINPLEPSIFGPRGTPIAPTDCRPQTMDHILQPADHRSTKAQRTPKRPKMGIDPIDSEMNRTKIHQTDPKWPQSHFGPFYKGNGDKTSPLNLQNV